MDGNKSGLGRVLPFSRAETYDLDPVCLLNGFFYLSSRSSPLSSMAPIQQGQIWASFSTQIMAQSQSIFSKAQMSKIGPISLKYEEEKKKEKRGKILHYGIIKNPWCIYLY